jgi:hypothetical protein
LNAENGLITSLETTSDEAYDSYQFTTLVDHDQKHYLPVESYTADKANDNGEYHYNLEVHGLHSSIRLKRTPTKMKVYAIKIWLNLCQTTQYKQGLSERYKTKRKFGKSK